MGVVGVGGVVGVVVGLVGVMMLGMVVGEREVKNGVAKKGFVVVGRNEKCITSGRSMTPQ